jgi:hypothetical protein
VLGTAAFGPNVGSERRVRSPEMPTCMQMAADIATCMYYTGIDPFTRDAVYIARALKDRTCSRHCCSSSSQKEPPISVRTRSE